MKTKVTTILAAWLLSSSFFFSSAHAQDAAPSPSKNNTIVLTGKDAYENGVASISIFQGKKLNIELYKGGFKTGSAWLIQQDNNNLQFLKDKPKVGNQGELVEVFCYEASSLGETTVTFTREEDQAGNLCSSPLKIVTFHINVVADDKAITPAAAPTPDSSTVSSDSSNANTATMYGCSDATDDHDNDDKSKAQRAANQNGGSNDPNQGDGGVPEDGGGV